MQKEKIIAALKELEAAQSNKSGYSAADVLNKLNIPATKENQKLLRKNLRALISKELYPEFATAGNKDVVYCPAGKYSGKYRLSEFRN